VGDVEFAGRAVANLLPTLLRRSPRVPDDDLDDPPFLDQEVRVALAAAAGRAIGIDVLAA
jgi:hypothetical protein